MWRISESNRWPSRTKAGRSSPFWLKLSYSSLLNERSGFYTSAKVLWRISESNRWPPACKAGALASWANSPCGGGGGNRTHVQRTLRITYYVCSSRLWPWNKAVWFCIPSKPRRFFNQVDPTTPGRQVYRPPQPACMFLFIGTCPSSNGFAN